MSTTGPENLNAAQKRAVETTEGYVRVIAGAGSGKTRTLSERFAYLVQDLGVMPGSILCVTFTNKSAQEMKQRIHTRIGDFDTGYICTFHGFCNTVLLEESHAIHYPRSFMVLDNTDIDAFLKMIYEERGLTLRHKTFAQARDMIEIRKLKEDPEYYRELIGFDAEHLKDRYMQATDPDDIVFYGYLYQEKKNFALDYNDLIVLTLHIFKESPETAQKWQERLEYIMIDEFQDIDGLQYELMTVLQKYHRNLFIVGDPDQTIYTWRGADPRYLLEFDRHFPDTQTLYLNENYRSTANILESANALIRQNTERIPKELVSVSGAGVPVHAGHYDSTAQEAQAVADYIEHLIHKGYEFKDIAVLYRAHYMSRPLEDAFMLRHIPYTIYSGVQFFQRMEIKDALSYLRMLVYRSDLDFIRTVNTPRRNIGKTRMDFLQVYAREHGKSLYEALQENLDHELFTRTQAAEYVDLIEHFEWQGRSASEVLSEVLNVSGYEAMMRLQGAQERLDNLAELKQAASEYELTAGEDVDIEAWLRHMALFSSTDRDMSAQKVKLMTIHTAKGLEFPAVILPGWNEGLFPSSRTRTRQAMEEERRLAFVALTRARRELLITDAAGKNLQGAWRIPSRFLLEIEGTLQWEPKPDESLLQQTRRKAGQGQTQETSMILQSGDTVIHKVFGEGVILETDLKTQSYLIHFDSLQTTRRLSVSAPLEKKEGGTSSGILH